MKYSLFIGRWQPFHEGHKKMIQKVIDEGKKPLIAIRNTPINKDNPYTLTERVRMIEKEFPENVKIVIIQDIEEICYGRDVGYKIREIKLDEETEKISGTGIRNDNVDNR